MITNTLKSGDINLCSAAVPLEVKMRYQKYQPLSILIIHGAILEYLYRYGYNDHVQLFVRV